MCLYLSGFIADDAWDLLQLLFNLAGDALEAGLSPPPTAAPIVVEDVVVVPHLFVAAVNIDDCFVYLMALVIGDVVIIVV